MIGTYLLKLALVLALVGALAWAVFWLTRNGAQRVPVLAALLPAAVGQGSAVRIVGAVSVGTGQRLVVAAFADRHWLVGVSRNQIILIGSEPENDA